MNNNNNYSSTGPGQLGLSSSADLSSSSSNYDLSGSEGGMGRPNPIQEMCFEIDLCPDLLIALIAAFAAAAFFFLYDAISMNGRRRRRRSPDRNSRKFSYRVHEILDALGMSSALMCLYCSSSVKCLHISLCTGHTHVPVSFSCTNEPTNLYKAVLVLLP